MKTSKTGEIKIEKGVPLPLKGIRSAFRSVLANMEIGDSVVVPAASRVGFHGAAKWSNRSVVTRKISPTEIRAWRTA